MRVPYCMCGMYTCHVLICAHVCMRVLPGAELQLLGAFVLASMYPESIFTCRNGSVIACSCYFVIFVPLPPGSSLHYICWKRSGGMM